MSLYRRQLVIRDCEKLGGPVIKAGTLILTCKPYAHALENRLNKSHCDFCFRSTTQTGMLADKIDDEIQSLSRCGGCGLIRYCDQECQRKGWNDGHRWECKGVKELGRLPWPFTRIMLKCVMKNQCGTDIYDKLGPTTRRRLKDLVTHYGDIKKDECRLDQTLWMIRDLESILSHHKNVRVPNVSELTALCGKIYVNTFCILDYEGHTIGSGLYLGASAFDHSCEPTAVATFEGTTINVRVIKDIPSNLPISKVTISYKDTLRPVGHRKLDLRRGYYFECECERCTEAMWELELTSALCSNANCLAEVNPNFQEKCLKCKEIFTQEFRSKIEELSEIGEGRIIEIENGLASLSKCETCIRVLCSALPESNWLVFNICTAVFDTLCDRKDWENAYNYGIISLKGHKKYLYPVDPTLGLLCFKLAYTTWKLGMQDEAKNFIIEAKRVLDITHGSDSPFSLKYLKILREITNDIYDKRELSPSDKGSPISF